MPNGLILLVVAIVVISAVVGAIAQFLNKMNEANSPSPRRTPARAERDVNSQVDKDMDRFLAEIDRLRRKNAEGGEPTAAKPAPPVNKPPLKPIPVTRQGRAEKPKKPRVVAELAEPQRRRVDSSAMAAPPAPVTPGTLSPDAHALPVAAVVATTFASGAPITKVTNLPTRARSSPKTNLAMNLTGLLNSGQGIAMAVILQEILGPPKSRHSA